MTTGYAARTGERLPKGGKVRKQPLLAGVGLVLVLGFGATFGSLMAGHSKTEGVLTLLRPVSEGHVIAAGDVGVAQVSGGGLRGYNTRAKSSVIGSTATGNLPAGTLLTPGMLVNKPLPGLGQQVVSAVLRAGALPPEVAAGSHVAVLSVAASTGVQGAAPASTGAGTPLVPDALVLSVSAGADGSGGLVSLVVTAAQAGPLSAAAANNQISLALLPLAPS